MAVILKQYCREQSLLLTIFVCCGIIYGAFGLLAPVLDDIRELFLSAGLDEGYSVIAFKAVAICIITEITRNICTDSGETSMAAAAGFWGRAALTYMSMPLLRAIVEMVKEML